MKNNDARKLSPEAQEAVRKLAVKAVDNGMSQTKVCETFSVSRTTLNTWLKKYRERGLKALNSQKRGRRKGK